MGKSKFHIGDYVIVDTRNKQIDYMIQASGSYGKVIGELNDLIYEVKFDYLVKNPIMTRFKNRMIYSVHGDDLKLYEPYKKYKKLRGLYEK